MAFRLSLHRGAVVALGGAACTLGMSQDLGRRSGRLTARPHVSAASTAAVGLTSLRLGRERDGLLYLPPNLKGPAPLVVLLHGAGGDASGIRRRLAWAADTLGFALLIPESRGQTWDAVRGAYGPDVAFLDSALNMVFARIPVDSSRVIIAGFSDGASYALGLGRINGDLFSSVVAFSPGFVPPGNPVARRPGVFITHGDADRILPFEVTSQRIAPILTRDGHRVTLKKFVGGHTVPAELALEAFRWALGAPPRDSIR